MRPVKSLGLRSKCSLALCLFKSEGSVSVKRKRIPGSFPVHDVCDSCPSNSRYDVSDLCPSHPHCEGKGRAHFKGPPKSSRIASHSYLFYNHTMDRNKSDFGMQGLISIINDIQEVFSIVGALFLNWITL